MGLSLILGLSLIASPVFAVDTSTPNLTESPAPLRISGNDRFQTALNISKIYQAGVVNDVIITSGNDFPDALAASVLAKKLNAPILLVGATPSASAASTTYLLQHLSAEGTVHIIGGEGVISKDFETSYKNLGVASINRIGGNTRYNTALRIAQQLEVSKNMPIIIVSGENFPDALSISSAAASKGYPILLTGNNGLEPEILNFIAQDQPSQVYIAGGIGVVPESVETAILTQVPSATITRLAGDDRFETTEKILNAFFPNPQTVYVASGMDFPDALSGSVLAASTADPIILTDPYSLTVPAPIEEYLKQVNQRKIFPNIRLFGGTGVVPDRTGYNVQAILNGQSQKEMKMTSLWTTDTIANMKAMATELFGVNTNTAFNYKTLPTARYSVAVESPSTEGYEASIYIESNDWDATGRPQYSQVKTVTKEILRFYFPTEYEKLYATVDKVAQEHLGTRQAFTMDRRSVALMTNGTQIIIKVGAPGQKISKLPW